MWEHHALDQSEELPEKEATDCDKDRDITYEVSFPRFCDDCSPGQQTNNKGFVWVFLNKRPPILLNCEITSPLFLQLFGDLPIRIDEIRKPA